MRKKVLWLCILALAFAAQSCLDNNDNTPKHTYLVTKIDSVSIPDTAKFNETTKIIIHTTIKNSCQRFYNFNYNHTGNERTISTIALQYDEVKCGEVKKISPELKFTPREAGDYKFRFWAGKDKTTKKDIFIIKEIHIKAAGK